jgi:hypothetical protein
MVAVMVGVIAGVASRKTDTGLTWWQELLIVVVGALIAALLLGGWDRLLARWRRPHIELRGGNEGLFRRQAPSQRRHDSLVPTAYPTNTVHITRLIAHETKGHKASAVHLRIVDSDTDDGTIPFPIGLQWISGAEECDFAPGGRNYVRLCEVPVDAQGEPTRVMTSIPGLTWGTAVNVEIELMIDGVARGIHSFLIDWRGDTDQPFDPFYPLVSQGPN